MIRTVTFGCSLPKAKADALNLESGAVYTRVLVEHYRIYRHTGHWLSVGAAGRIEDQLGGPTTLHTATHMPSRAVLGVRHWMPTVEMQRNKPSTKLSRLRARIGGTA